MMRRTEEANPALTAAKPSTPTTEHEQEERDHKQKDTTGLYVRLCNCVGRNEPAYLPRTLAERPEASPYLARQINEREDDTPGTILVNGSIVSCFAQFWPGRHAESRPNKGKGGKCETNTKERRPPGDGLSR